MSPAKLHVPPRPRPAAVPLLLGLGGGGNSPTAAEEGSGPAEAAPQTARAQLQALRALFTMHCAPAGTMTGDQFQSFIRPCQLRNVGVMFGSARALFAKVRLLFLGFWI